jgi:hypothetical protein
MSGQGRTRFCPACHVPLDQTGNPLRVNGEPDTGPYRMSDVIQEIREIQRYAAGAETSEEMANACERAQQLLLGLRRQFVTEVILGHPAPAGVSGDPQGARSRV